MDKEAALREIENFKRRLSEEVCNAYRDRGSDYGRERFSAWRSRFEKYLSEKFPSAKERLTKKLNVGIMIAYPYESDYEAFMREKGDPTFAFIDSLMLDIANDEYEENEHNPPPSKDVKPSAKKSSANSKVFIVHGHDEAMQAKAARFVEKLGFEAIILHEQANRGRTIIEKIESNTDVGFAIVLYTDDDIGNAKKDAKNGLVNPRARQNVVFEHGYLMSKLGREKVAPPRFFKRNRTSKRYQRNCLRQRKRLANKNRKGNESVRLRN